MNYYQELGFSVQETPVNVTLAPVVPVSVEPRMTTKTKKKYALMAAAFAAGLALVLYSTKKKKV